MITGTFTTAESTCGTITTCTTGTSATLKERCNCGTFAVFLHAPPRAFVVEHNGHVNDLVQERIRRVQLWDLGCLHTDRTRGICWTCPTVTSTTFSMDCNWRIYVFLNSQDHRNLHLRHDRNVDDLDTRGLCTWRLHNNGQVNNRSKSSAWKISTVIFTVCTVGTRHCIITGMSNHCR